MFVNFSNHPSANWGQNQIMAAQKWGEIVDISFPVIDASYSEKDISKLKNEYVEKIVDYSPTAVMCMGEFTLSYAVISELIKRDITVVAACSMRRSVEITDENGRTKRESIFEFEKFREYRQ